MSNITDAFPELDRVRRFFPLGVENPQLLTQQQIDPYNTKVYVFPFDGLIATEIAVYRAYFDDLSSKACDAGLTSS